jgi:hypothetical protein
MGYVKRLGLKMFKYTNLDLCLLLGHKWIFRISLDVIAIGLETIHLYISNNISYYKMTYLKLGLESTGKVQKQKRHYFLKSYGFHSL